MRSMTGTSRVGCTAKARATDREQNSIVTTECGGEHHLFRLARSTAGRPRRRAPRVGSRPGGTRGTAPGLPSSTDAAGARWASEQRQLHTRYGSSRSRVSVLPSSMTACTPRVTARTRSGSTTNGMHALDRMVVVSETGSDFQNRMLRSARSPWSRRAIEDAGDQPPARPWPPRSADGRWRRSCLHGQRQQARARSGAASCDHEARDQQNPAARGPSRSAVLPGSRRTDHCSDLMRGLPSATNRSPGWACAERRVSESRVGAVEQQNASTENLALADRPARRASSSRPGDLELP
jgi:hypothetical protein